jgi:hypothetical protein
MIERRDACDVSRSDRHGTGDSGQTRKKARRDVTVWLQ